MTTPGSLDLTIGTWIEEAVAAGASRRAACELLGISLRSVQRWRGGSGLADRRKGAAKQVPRKLSSEELELLYRTANEPRFQDMTPGEIVPTLLDEGIYLGSERTLYRILKARKALAPRQESRAPLKRTRPSELVATGPNQVWCWDITWLKTDVAGLFQFAYVVEDVFSRRIDRLGGPRPGGPRTGPSPLRAADPGSGGGASVRACRQRHPDERPHPGRLPDSSRGRLELQPPAA